MLRILHTNDLHGMLTPEKAARLKELRQEVDLYFDSGDAIKAGNLAIPLKPEAVWPLLAALRCDASVPGNRESHVLRSAVEAKFKGLQHPVLCANWHGKQVPDPFPASTIVEMNGLRVGVLGVMVPMVTKRMATAAASQFLWSNPVEVAVDFASHLKTESDVVIALTHIGFSQDKLLAEATRDIDIILGGHSHTVLEQPVKVNETWIAQGGSHGRFAGLYDWDGNELTGGLVSLSQPCGAGRRKRSVRPIE